MLQAGHAAMCMPSALMLQQSYAAADKFPASKVIAMPHSRMLASFFVPLRLHQMQG